MEIQFARSCFFHILVTALQLTVQILVLWLESEGGQPKKYAQFHDYLIDCEHMKLDDVWLFSWWR